MELLHSDSLVSSTSASTYELFGEKLSSAARTGTRHVTEARQRGDIDRAMAAWKLTMFLQRASLAFTEGADSKGIPLPPSANVEDGPVFFDEGEIPFPIWEAIGAAFDIHRWNNIDGMHVSLNVKYEPTCGAFGACVWRAEGRVVGALLWAPDSQFRWLDEVEQFGIDAEIQEPGPCARIFGVWTASAFRGKGIATQLAALLAERRYLRVDELIHTPPFSEAGRRYATRLSGSEWVRVAKDWVPISLKTDSDQHEVPSLTPEHADQEQ